MPGHTQPWSVISWVLGGDYRVSGRYGCCPATRKVSFSTSKTIWPAATSICADIEPPPPRGVNQPFPKCGPEVQKFQRTPQGFSSRGRFLAPALGAGGGTGFGGGAFGNSNTQGETAAASFAKGGTLSRFQLCAVPTDCVIISHSGPAFLSAAASAGFNKKKTHPPRSLPAGGMPTAGQPPPPQGCPSAKPPADGGASLAGDSLWLQVDQLLHRCGEGRLRLVLPGRRPVDGAGSPRRSETHRDPPPLRWSGDWVANWGPSA